MTLPKTIKVLLILTLCAGVAACGSRRADRSGGLFGRVVVGEAHEEGGALVEPGANARKYAKSSIWDAFGPNRNDQTVNVNRYIWAATLDVLNFLPVQSVDPFTGVIITGYGTPPGGGRAYRATVHVRDPSLDARSLNVSLQGQGGSVSAGTVRAVEDAILARARQMRIRDRKL
ncbi:DUF3576 domain-containing protein [Arenibacterium halophilum]|uniref:DUF3576 domain-containing protein n=1 Tax=Arenibacterium halophilum TaxID=2583821 RepID=A0ABY2X5X8_9RHOB|nr:DUF3576 domain-containing protein [Arenibacterium halophilum]TMV10514.1 DUF3576 domain-containing protein [Arenibacterium halophilum]